MSSEVRSYHTGCEVVLPAWCTGSPDEGHYLASWNEFISLSHPHHTRCDVVPAEMDAVRHQEEVPRRGMRAVTVAVLSSRGWLVGIRGQFILQKVSTVAALGRTEEVELLVLDEQETS